MGNDTRTMTLTDFLLRRIAEDEAVAQVCSPGPWEISHDFERVEGPDGWVADGWATDVRQLVRWQPARVLAECEAKRRIVKAFEDERVRRDIYNRDYDSGEYDFNQNDLRARLASNAHCRGIEIAMLALALPYADHPEFREDWRA